jgi:lincosamide nucleotidyltransferase A/C/D/E
MISAEDVTFIYSRLESHSIRSWLTGGWGIDALLGQCTRTHKDLDILLLVDDVLSMNTLLEENGYHMKELWSENLFTVDSSGNSTPTAYVLHDKDEHELDAHAFRFDPQGNAIPAWKVEEGFIFEPYDLSSLGIVNGLCVRCQSAENQMLCHTGYTIPDHQWPDLNALHEKFGVEFPEEIAAQRLHRNTN